VGRAELWRIRLRRRAPSPEKALYRLGLRSPAGLTLPDALCIGAQKAGTTWLYRNLERHPEVFVPPEVKEVHYFDFLYRQPLCDYAAVFADGADRVKCDVTPNYGRLRSGRIRFIRRVMPDVRLVFLMRNPVERAWSQALMDLATRADRPWEEVPLEAFRRFLRRPSVVGNGLYTRMLERWLAVFPGEQLFVGFFDDVVLRPRSLLADVFEHLGVRRDVDWDEFPWREKVHEGVGVPIPEALRGELADAFGPELTLLAERFGGAAVRWREEMGGRG